MCIMRAPVTLSNSSLDALALAEAVEHGSHRADIKAIDAVEQHVACDAVQLAEYDADILCALGDLNAHQLLDGEDESEFAVEVTHIVEAVEERDDLAVKLALAQLFRAAMEVANVWLGADDALAVNPDYDTEDAVRARMLRPHVDHEVERVCLLSWVLLDLHGGRSAFQCLLCSSRCATISSRICLTLGCGQSMTVSFAPSCL